LNYSAHKLAVVIPTIGRRTELRRMLVSLASQTRLPDQVVIVDEDQSSSSFVRDFRELEILVIALPGSATSKRNAGFEAARPGMTLIDFMDDDIVLEPHAIEAGLRFWESAPKDLGGMCLNVLNDSPRPMSWLKGRKTAFRLGLYATEKGAVLRSGFHVPFGHVSKTIYVDWLPTYCVVYAKEALGKHPFDEFFKGYSYLEDLDLSYRIGRKYRLAVVAEACFYHYPSGIGRPDSYLFGRKEVVNRLYFVGKHREFSRGLCWFSLFVRMLLSIFDGFKQLKASPFKRAAGNLAGVLLAVKDGLRPV
jgi:GT2 family glycosyltransferase